MDRLSPFPFLAPLALAVGIMLSPESLVMLGHGAGNLGATVVPLLFLAAGIHLYTARKHGEVASRFSEPAGEIRLLRSGLGALAAAILLLCSRLLFVVCAGPLILAAAGYVFNEIFAHWFPNLGFSFALLGIVLAINLLGRRAALTTQVVLVTTSVLGLVSLMVAGLLGDPVVQAHETGYQSGGPAGSAILLLFLFVGYDLAATALPEKDGSYRSLRAISTGVVSIVLLFGGWGLLSASYVAPAKLAESTTPHLLAARAILGDTGRTVMGIAVLTGSTAAVNLLVFSVSRILAAMANAGMLPSRIAGRGSEPRLAVFLVALGPAVMMGLGMAGEPETEIYARGALLFWLLLYGAFHFSLLRLRRSRPSPFPVGALLGFLVMLAAVLVVLLTDPHGVQLLGFMTTIALLSLAGVAAWGRKEETACCCGNSPCLVKPSRPGGGDDPIRPAS